MPVPSRLPVSRLDPPSCAVPFQLSWQHFWIREHSPQLRRSHLTLCFVTRRRFTRKSSTMFGTALYETVGMPSSADSTVIVPPDPTNTSVFSSRYLPSCDMDSTLTLPARVTSKSLCNFQKH